MRRLFLVLPISAIVIAVLVVYRLNRPPAPPVAAAIASAVRPAPLFQLYDENSQIVRLSRYLGRHKLLIVFFDGRQGIDGSGLLAALRDEAGYRQIAQTRAVVLAITALRPSEMRLANNEQGQRVERDRPVPFPMLADIHDYEVHRQYGAWDIETDEPREAVFVVDRTGIIQHGHLGPGALGTPALWADELNRAR